jgi:hypothetical protein
LTRLLDWLNLSPNHGATQCKAGSQYFVRLCLPGYWRVTQKDFPSEFIGPGGTQRDQIFSCIGYSDIGYEEALTEALARLPG